MTAFPGDRRVLSLEIQDGPLPGVVGRPGGVWRDLNDSVYGRSIVSPRGRWLKWDRVGLFKVEPEARKVRVWVDSKASIELVRSQFRQEVQFIALQSMGYETLHASAVRGPNGAVAFCGASGAGKSTLAYAMKERGWSHLADDHVVVDFASGTPGIWSLPFQPRLRHASAAHFGGSPSMADVEGADTLVPLSLVIFVEQNPQLPVPYVIEQVPGAQAFGELLPHVHCFDPRDPLEVRRLVQHYLSLLDMVPVYRLKYRPSFDELHHVVRAIEEQPCAFEEARSA